MYKGEQLTYNIAFYTNAQATTPADITAATAIYVNLVLYGSPRDVLAKYSLTPAPGELLLTVVSANPAVVSLTIPSAVTINKPSAPLVFESKVVYANSKLEDKVKFDDLYAHTLADK